MMSPMGMTVLLGLGLGAFLWTTVRRFKLLRVAAAPDDRMDQSDKRIDSVVRFVFRQERMFRYPGAGIAHTLIFAGFVILLLRTLILFARGFSSDPGFGFALFDDGTILGVLYTFGKDIVGVLVIVGVAYFLWSRFVTKPARVELSTEGVVILLMILGIIFSDMTYEATGFVMGAADGAALTHGYAPSASLLAIAMQQLPEAGVGNLHNIAFWLHALIVLTFLNILPYGKHFHILTVLPNVYFRHLGGIGRLRPIDDIEGKLEREETLGVKTAADLSWKDALDLYTCTECGRCSDHCPAFNTGKLLSPKQLTIDLRDHMYSGAGEMIRAGTASDDSGAFQPLVAQTVDPEMLWACTTCGACEQECPVLISYVDKIVDMRRNLVMEQGKFPEPLQNTFRALETVGNPYSFPNEQRADWAAGLDVPLYADNPGAEILYWVGCAPSYDDRSRKIARAFAQLMQTAGVDFAILGPQEKCTGDPARRAGNEYLFQTLAKENVETLNNAGVRTIVSTCPHCYNTIKNEYPEFGGEFEVLHHTELLAQLLAEGRLVAQHAIDGEIVYHDSCYIGRYNDVYDPPREILKSIPGLRVVEADETRDRGMCCGAGGAQMWKEDEPIRREGSREGDGKVNHARVRQLLRVLPNEAQPRSIATACPFCKTMLSDGLTDQGHEDVGQQDVAEILLRSVQGSEIVSARTAVTAQSV